MTDVVPVRGECAEGLRRSLFLCDRGMAAVIAAILMPLVIGGLGLGAETGFWYMKKNRLQAAADVAAHAAAIRLRAGATHADLEAAVLSVASGSGFMSSKGAHVVRVPPSEGRYMGLAGHVEVVLAETHPRMFSAIFSEAPMEVGARSVAAVHAGEEACALALLPGAEPGLSVSREGSFQADGCALATNSAAPMAVRVEPGGLVEANCIYSVGGVQMDGSLSLDCGGPRTRSHPVADPYVTLQEPAVQTLPCRSPGVTLAQGRSGVLLPIDWLGGRMAQRICGDMAIRGNMHLLPGIYVAEGAVEVFPGGSLSGAGVTLYMRQSGRFVAHHGSSVDLSAAESGLMAGIVIMGSRTGSRTISVTGGHAAAMRGAVYAPTSEFRVTGFGSPHPSCLQVVAGRITVEGPMSLKRGCSPATKVAYAGRQVAVVE